KMYYLEIDGEFTKNDILLCQEGLMIKDGKGRFLKTKPGELKIIKQSKAYLTIYEGKYHQVKQMCNQLGKPLLYLRRERIGTINLDSNLQLGEYRLLTNQEIEEFKKQFT
ncbi:MAG: 16S rRNA pseudouridine(516) synthase, partial [Bacilli bacterium]